MISGVAKLLGLTLLGHATEQIQPAGPASRSLLYSYLFNANDPIIAVRNPGSLNNERIALGPIGAVHGEEPHPPVAHMDL